MPRTEAESMRRYAIGTALQRMVHALDGLDEAELNWRPAEDANSLAVIAMHVYANIEENILGMLFGEDIQRDRDAEFAHGSIRRSNVIARGEAVRGRIDEALSTLTQTDLERMCHHPRRGDLSGREVLLVAGRHAAEHAGHAELTRVLIVARSQRAG